MAQSLEVPTTATNIAIVKQMTGRISCLNGTVSCPPSYDGHGFAGRSYCLICNLLKTNNQLVLNFFCKSFCLVLQFLLDLCRKNNHCFKFQPTTPSNLSTYKWIFGWNWMTQKLRKTKKTYENWIRKCHQFPLGQFSLDQTTGCTASRSPLARVEWQDSPDDIVAWNIRAAVRRGETATEVGSHRVP